MDLLKAVNLILPRLGEHAVTELDVKHPTLAILLPVIEYKINELTVLGWWFNKYRAKYYPDLEGSVAVPDDVMSFIPDQRNITIRGRRLYNITDQSYKFSAVVEGVATALLPFEDLPDSMAQWVMAAALVDAYVTDIGLTDDVRVWQNQAQLAKIAVETENLRQMRYSTTDSPRYQRLLGALRG
jgi:hypothetical protein